MPRPLPFRSTWTVPLLAALALLGGCAPSGREPVRFAAGAEVDPDVRQVVERCIAAVERDPANARAHRSLGLAYEANTAWGEAERAYANALALDPSDSLCRLHRAICLEEAGAMDEAFDLLKETVAQSPDSVRARWRYGVALLLRDELEVADEQFRFVAGRLANAPHGFLGQGEVALALGDAQRAADLLLTALGKSPSDGYVSFQLGTAYSQLGRDLEAERLLTTGEGATRPGIGDALSNELAGYARSRAARIGQATTLLQGEEVVAAERLLRELREQYPDDEAVVSNLAVALTRQLRFEEALEVIDDLVRINPEQHAAYINRAGCLLDLGQIADQGGDRAGAQRLWADALSAADQAVRLAPHIALAHLKRAQVLMRLRMLEESILEMQEALRLGNRSEDVYLNLAKLQEVVSGQAAAVLTLEEGRAENASFVELRARLIQYHALAGNGAEARAIQQELVAIAPNDQRTKAAHAYLTQRGM